MHEALQTTAEGRPSRRPRAGYAALAAVLTALLTLGLIAPAGANGDKSGWHKTYGNKTQREDVLQQGGEGVYAEDGAKLKRKKHSIKVTWKVETPAPGSYAYPTADMVPPGAPPHPEIEPGFPEVFTLWAFVFNNPELCDGPCDGNDIGDTPAQGGVYQLDATIALDDRIKMRGRVKVGDTPAAGVALQDPKGAEVHVAMAPHGRVGCGDDLDRQLNGAVGTPAFWFPAFFFA